MSVCLWVCLKIGNTPKMGGVLMVSLSIGAKHGPLRPDTPTS